MRRLVTVSGNRGTQRVLAFGHRDAVEQLELAAAGLDDEDFAGEVHHVNLAVSRSWR